jgi:hypothetical protein
MDVRLDGGSEALTDRPGNYFLVNREPPGTEWLRQDIDELMKPLIRLQETDSGMMVSYRLTDEVRDHFGAVALGLADEWREEAGIHPDAKLGGVSGKAISIVALSMISRHLAHTRYVQLAAALDSRVSIPLNLTSVVPRARFEDEFVGAQHSMPSRFVPRRPGNFRMS